MILFLILFVVFIMKKRFKLDKLKTEPYSKIIIDNNYIKTNNICSVNVPMNLDIAYDKYKNPSFS